MKHFLFNNRDSLYRGLALPFTFFVLMACFVLVGYISYWSQSDALRQLKELATTNATVVDTLQLPRSTALAEKLSTVLGLWVGFYQSGRDNPSFEKTGWPVSFKSALEEALNRGVRAYQLSGYDVATAVLSDGHEHLVLVRKTRSLLTGGLRNVVLMPTLLLTLACGSLAFYLARRIVLPLTALTQWLPQLEKDDQAAPAIPQAVARRSDEIGELGRSLKLTHQRLREERLRRQQSERMAALGRIATSLAHEIRNPACSIGLHADLLAQNCNAQISESIRLIKDDVSRINDLVNQWLFVVRPAPPLTSPHKLVSLVEHVAESLQPAMKHAGVKLSISKPGTDIEIHCDSPRLAQVVRNLLVNAIQAMPEGGDLQLSFQPSPGQAILKIQDTGTGFSPAALARFGEPFFSEREGGMGIGLTLACEVIAAHGGSIEAMNTPHGGAIVMVRLPLTHSATTERPLL